MILSMPTNCRQHPLQRKTCRTKNLLKNNDELNSKLEFNFDTLAAG